MNTANPWMVRLKWTKLMSVRESQVNVAVELAGKAPVFGMVERKGDVEGHCDQQPKRRYCLPYHQGICTAKEYGLYR